MFRLSLVALSLVGCSLYTDPWAYEEVQLSPQLDTLSPGCARCLQDSCRESYDACAADTACINLAACIASDPTPYGYRACGGTEQVRAYSELLRCKDCEESCRIGTNFDCTGRYSWPAAEPTVRVGRHFVSDGTGASGKALDDTVLRACGGRGIDCGPATRADAGKEPDAQQEKDLLLWQTIAPGADGSVEVELPADSRAGGFTGHFVLSGEDIPIYRLHSTNPIPAGVEVKRLLSRQNVTELQLAAAACPATQSIGDVNLETTGNVLFQVTDCLGFPAPSVSLQLRDEQPDAVIVYKNETLCPSLEGTTLGGLGAGAILNVPARTTHLVVDVLRDGRPISETTITVVPGQMSVLDVQPAPASVVKAWPR